MDYASTSSNEPSYVAKQRLNSELASVESEILSVQADIEQLTDLLDQLHEKKRGITDALRGHDAPRAVTATVNGASSVKGKGKAPAIDYTEQFEWTPGLKDKMKRVFGIQNFRLCQEGVCNASVDGRDIVCVMPTGGGKSLTYQLPALLTPGCTLVISPLISLITDQILHLQDAGVEAVKLTGTTSKEESNSITARLDPKNLKLGADGRPYKEIKLCYVTPEKIAKSKRFVALLEKMYKANKLARIVIDEAHCVSQIGHDFRPDYKQLNILRQLFPKTPIMALSATCPPKVLKDLLLILRLRDITNGNEANRDGTVYFTAPLYRKNLLYKVLPKPSSAQATIEAMCDYILQQHRNDSGIVYCLSKKDTEQVAEGLREASARKIKTGVYHSDCPAKEKELLHKSWREGNIKVVCATIAFGLGIDKGDVRFVLHHSMSKSLDGFYQESGRAGRDGLNADCVLYYRPQDVSRLSALVAHEVEGQDKLHSMLKFAHNVADCRKILFANYFSTSSSLALSSWTADPSGSLAPCGHCDNCNRPSENIEKRNIATEAWQILRIVQNIEEEGGRVTIGMLADLVRGAGGAAFSVSNGGGRKRKSMSKEKVGLDLDVVAGGKVALGKDEVEAVIIHLLLNDYLKEEFSQTAYTINVYVCPGKNAIRFTRLSRDAIQNDQGPNMEFSFIKKASAKGSSRRKSTGETSALTERKKLPVFKSSNWPPKRGGLQKTDSNVSFKTQSDIEREEIAMPDVADDEDEWESFPMIDKEKEASTTVIDVSDDSEPDFSSTTLFDKSTVETEGKEKAVSRPRPRPKAKGSVLVSDTEDDDSDADAEFTFTLDGRPRKRTRLKAASPDREVIDVSP